MQQDPAYADEIRQDPSKFAPKKDRQGKAKGESEEFEKWANRTESKVNEGIHSLPDEDHAGEHFSKLKDVMSKHFPVGNEAVNAVSVLQSLGFGDDELFDQLGELADQEGPDACACETVKNYIMNTLLQSPNIQNYYTPEQITALQDAASAADNRTDKKDNKSDDSFDYAMSTTKAPAESVVKESNRPIMIDGKQVDLNTVEYEMQDASDNVYDLQDARFTDGTELSGEQMEKLMVDMNFNDWVQQDYAERGADAMQEAPAVDTSDMTMVGIGHGEKEEVQQILNKHKADFDRVKAGDELMTHDNLYSELFSYYMSNGEMPYAVAKAREGSPDTWIMDRLDSMGLLETIQKEAEASIDDQYRFRDWLKSTHNKEVHQLTPQEYTVISKQYRDEKNKQGTKTEGNEFAQAVQKAKAAGMKPGDKFKVADKEYTLKDAIELAGLQLEDFNFTSESVGGGPTVTQMSDLELANFLHTSVAEVKKDREAAEEAAEELNQKYASDNESVKENELDIIKRLSGI